jgi:Winged helix-turn helix
LVIWFDKKKLKYPNISALFIFPYCTNPKPFCPVNSWNWYKRWIEEKPTYTLKELVNKFAMELELSIGKSSVHRALIKLGFSHITGRKKHYKSDEDVQEFFKKN